MVSRSSWEPDALQLYYVARVVTVGHVAPIRGYFRVNGLGRQWLTFRSRGNHHSRANSLVTVDGEGQDNSAVRTLHYSGVAKDKEATFDSMGSDLTAAYRHANNPWPNLNYTRLKPDARPWYNMPFKYLVHWYYGDRPQNQILDPGEVVFDPQNYSGKKEFAYAYRTAKAARCRTLIYAHKEGDELPKITVGNGRYTISIGDQVDELRLGNSPGDRISIVRKYP